jgi:hypothetical protein
MVVVFDALRKGQIPPASGGEDSLVLEVLVANWRDAERNERRAVGDVSDLAVQSDVLAGRKRRKVHQPLSRAGSGSRANTRPSVSATVECPRPFAHGPGDGCQLGRHRRDGRGEIGEVSAQASNNHFNFHSAHEWHKKKQAGRIDGAIRLREQGVRRASSSWLARGPRSRSRCFLGERSSVRIVEFDQAFDCARSWRYTDRQPHDRASNNGLESHGAAVSRKPSHRPSRRRALPHVAYPVDAARKYAA